MFDSLPAWFPVLGWGVTAVGWVISSGQANSREARKEKRTEVDACCKLAAEILDKARKYYAKAPDEDTPADAADLSFSVKRLLKRLERLQKQQSTFEVADAGGELFETVTGGDFDSASRLARKPSDPHVAAIENAVHRVIDDLESGFEATFKGWRQRLAEWRRDRQRWGR